jgi:hypothetical protein
VTQHATVTSPNTGDLFEIIRATPCVRLKPDPVLNELIRKISVASVYAQW